MGPDSVRTLRVWKEGMTLVKESYALTAAWPKSELFGLYESNQTRGRFHSQQFGRRQGKRFCGGTRAICPNRFGVGI